MRSESLFATSFASPTRSVVIMFNTNDTHLPFLWQTIEESVLSELLGLVQENAVGTWIEMYGWKVGRALETPFSLITNAFSRSALTTS